MAGAVVVGVSVGALTHKARSVHVVELLGDRVAIVTAVLAVILSTPQAKLGVLANGVITIDWSAVAHHQVRAKVAPAAVAPNLLEHERHLAVSILAQWVERQSVGSVAGR